jgi:hypothetical protein
MSGKQTKRARQAMRASGLTPRLDRKRAAEAAAERARLYYQAARLKRMQEDPEGYARDQAKSRERAQQALAVMSGLSALVGSMPLHRGGIR